MKLARLLLRIIDIPATEWKLLCKAFVLSAAFKIMVRFVPLKYYFSVFYWKPAVSDVENRTEQAMNLARRTMGRLVRFSPLDYSCLVKTLTMKMLLNSLGIESRINFGILKADTNTLKAHASLHINDHSEYLESKAFRWCISL